MSFLKKLIYADYKEEPALEQKQKTSKKEVTKFPLSNNFDSSNTIIPENHILPKNVKLSQACEQHMDKLLDVYQKTFDGLNIQGYDFYEFLEAILSADETGKNSLAYTMAFSMAIKMEKSITKNSLTKQADYYITEINKAHATYVSNGNNKKTELINQKNNENQSLSQELEMLKQQAEAIKIQIEDKQNKLSKMDEKYSPQLNEVDCKLIANDMAKDKIISTIQIVKNGIETNIK